jgi:hypothetical protein
MTMNEIKNMESKLEKLLESDNYEDRLFAINKMQELGNLVHINRETSNIGDNDTANYYFQKLQREVNSRTSQSNNDARDIWLALKYGIVR